MTAPGLRRAAIDTALVALALLDAILGAARVADDVLALSVLAALGLAVRRRWPYVAFVLAMPALFIAYVLVAPLAALYTVAATARSRWPVVGCSLVTAAGYYLPWPPPRAFWDEPVDHLGLIYTAVFVAAPVALGILNQTRQDLVRILGEVREGQGRERRLVAERVLAQERARLAREMHDVVSHQVSLIAVQAGALGATARDEDVRASARTIRQLSVRTLDELRHMIGVLRRDDSSPVDVFPQRRLADIPQLVDEVGQDVTLDLRAAQGREWPEPVERAVYRTVQEGLTNARKHAPGAPVSVTVEPQGTGLCVTVRNTPPSTRHTVALPVGGGHGLAGLRERADLLGGSLSAGATADGGFVLRAMLPDSVRDREVARGAPGRIS